MLLKINPQNPQERLIAKVVDSLRQGGIIAFPTDTFYAIGCDIMQKKSVEKIYQIKQRHKSKPFSFICCDLKDISEYAKVTDYAYRTMKRLLPGPYTFILEGSRPLPKTMVSKRKTAGIRVPDNAICMAIVRALGNPVISTTAKLPDKGVYTDPELIHDHFGKLLDIVVDGGPVPCQPSSILSFVDEEPEIIRRGLGPLNIFE
ncbi:MAG: L-threonylcarbamoyladenylate synthase [Thermodesulfobacteriota bacterium]|nr:L-threonylcarbamoyladenylate synthase [Thermodesulfobacteriota bacterium]